MMTPLVETVARADPLTRTFTLADKIAFQIIPERGEQDIRDHALRVIAYKAAQAAIAAVFDALETPSEGMMNCGVGAIMNYPGGATITSRHEALKLAFPAMIAKAREEMLNGPK